MKFYFRVYIYGLGELHKPERGEAESKKEMVEKIRQQLLFEGFKKEEVVYINFYSDSERHNVNGQEKLSPLFEESKDDKARIFTDYYSEIMGELLEYDRYKLNDREDFPEFKRWVCGKFAHLKSEIEWNKKG
ncbi:MAG: hypothetical protein RLZZ74_3453 [Cyanobacteriota bacterium]|jgi:hypothetical protein